MNRYVPAWPAKAAVFTALVCAGFFMCAVAGGAAAQVPVQPLQVGPFDSAKPDNLTAVVTAPEALSGESIPDSAFTGSVNGKKTAVRVEALPADKLEVVLVVDTSGSMAGAPMIAAKEAAKTFVRRISATTRLGLIGFGPVPILASPLSTDRAAVNAAIDGLREQGETALYDALELAVAQFGPEANIRRSIVVLSDGGDTASRIGLEAVISRLREAGVRVDVAELVTSESDTGALNRISAVGGGSVVSATDPSALSGVYDTLARGLVNQYKVSLDPGVGGKVEIALRLEFGAVVAEGRQTLDIPPLGGKVVAKPKATSSDGDGLFGSPLALALGALAAFGALCIGFIAVLQRARDVDPRRLSPSGSPDQGPTGAGTTGGAPAGGAPAGGAITELTERATVALEEVLERRGQRRALDMALEGAGIHLRSGEFLVLALAAVASSMVVGLLLSGLLLGVILAVVAGISARVLVTVMATRRADAFAEQIGDTLQLLSGTLRAGYALLQAIDAVAREADAPTAEEFRRVVVEARLGRDLSESLHATATRMRSEDFEWVAQAIDIHRQIGGDLSEVLDNLARTVRERNQYHRMVKTLTAEGRLSGNILLALPPLLALYMSVVNPDYFNELTQGVGLVLVVVGGVFMTIGAIWIRRLCRLDF